jgi:sterol desaturase/sphingolipid hydroxylase (fatty acid hydroxylase superfamily)
MLTYLLVSILLMIVFYILIYITKNHKNYAKRNLDTAYCRTVIINYAIISFLSLALIKYINLFENRCFPDIKLIVFYFLVIDAIYYWVHRLSHRIPFIKRAMHNTHHDVYNLLPIDFLHVSVVEYILYFVTTMCFPLLFIHVSIVEYLFIVTIILFHQIYTHSEENKPFFLPGFIDSKYHKYHHQIGQGNYSIFFPLWDNYMKTRIRKNNIKKKKSPTNDRIK